MNRILVTGSTGLIGIEVARHLSHFTHRMMSRRLLQGHGLGRHRIQHQISGRQHYSSLYPPIKLV